MMAGWGLSAPWLLLGLCVLPGLWWLLRVTPPAPRRIAFPSVALLIGLGGPASAARTPLWLMMLRLVAAVLAILGLAGPMRRSASIAASAGGVAVVIDDGWASAPEWSERLRAAADTLDALATPDAPTRLLTTAPSAEGAAPALGPTTPARDFSTRLAALRPLPWPVDRAAAAAALAALPGGTRVIYVADGVAAPGDAAFAAALGRLGSVTELRGGLSPVLLRPAAAEPDRLTFRVETVFPSSAPVLARALDAAGVVLSVAPTADGTGVGAMVLPPDLRSRVASVRLGETGSAGATFLLDEAAPRRPVGVLEAGADADRPLVGSLFFVRRALATRADVRSGSLGGLIASKIAVLVLADGVITNPERVAELTGWVRGGGVLIRFAGPQLAGSTAPDPLLPAPLLEGDRELGGAMSWSQPATLAPFDANSPFAGLVAPAEVTVRRQVLAQPGAAPLVWASLADGSPLVTAAPLGAGKLVLFHVTANADWSNLPLSELFPDMLDRLVQLSAGVRAKPSDALLAPSRALDAFGVLGPPDAAARPVREDAIATTPAGPAHPPGLYGPAGGAQALNLSATLPRLTASASIAGAAERSLAGHAATYEAGPALLIAALLLLAIDALASLKLRGLILAGCVLMLGTAQAAAPAMPSLATHLAYVTTGDAQADGVAEAGLRGLSAVVNARTNAMLAAPVAVDPAHDELSFYPLLYWPILADAPTPDGATLARLDDYMQDGGIILFDTRDDGSDAGAQSALQRIGAALTIPPLRHLTAGHVLSHAFYLLRAFPGRLDGPVWVAASEDSANDGVSPVIVGGNDWGAAWATDVSGDTLYQPDGGEAARVLAYRFGVNLVIYALTGNYKADQVHAPELLRRMGEAPP